MSVKPLSQMSESALVKMAEELGIEVNAATTSKKLLIALIEDKQGGQSRVEDPDNGENEESVVEEAPAKKVRKTKHFKIIVHAQEGNDNTPFIKVGVQGVMYQINRDEEVVVNEYVLHVLENCVMTVPQKVGDKTVQRDIRRFPFSILGEV